MDGLSAYDPLRHWSRQRTSDQTRLQSLRRSGLSRYDATVLLNGGCKAALFQHAKGAAWLFSLRFLDPSGWNWYAQKA